MFSMFSKKIQSKRLSQTKEWPESFFAGDISFRRSLANTVPLSSSRHLGAFLEYQSANGWQEHGETWASWSFLSLSFAFLAGGRLRTAFSCFLLLLLGSRTCLSLLQSLPSPSSLVDPGQPWGAAYYAGVLVETTTRLWSPEVHFQPMVSSMYCGYNLNPHPADMYLYLCSHRIAYIMSRWFCLFSYTWPSHYYIFTVGAIIGRSPFWVTNFSYLFFFAW